MRTVIDDDILTIDTQPRTVRAVDHECVFPRRVDDQRGRDLDGVIRPAASPGERKISGREIAIQSSIDKVDRRVVSL